MSVTKATIVDSICKRSGCSKTQSIDLIESILEIIKKTLESGEDVLVSGFGKLCVKEKNERRGRHPQTGDDLILRLRRVVIFKCSNLLRNKINGKV